MPKTRQQKEETVESLSDKLKQSKSVVFANYQGMTMKQLSDLRKTLREQSAEFSITKNNLMKLALKNAQMSVGEKIDEGPTATLFSFEDEISPLKILTKALKDGGVGKIKGGLIEQEYFDEYLITRLSNLPGKDELRAKVVGALRAPIYGVVSVLQANLRNLVYALEQIRISRGGE